MNPDPNNIDEIRTALDEQAKRDPDFKLAAAHPPSTEVGIPYDERQSELDVSAAEMGWDGATTAAEREATERRR